MFANYFAVQHHDIFSPIIVVRTSVNPQKVCCITVLLNDCTVCILIDWRGRTELLY